jgi:hypothetical protein
MYAGATSRFTDGLAGQGIESARYVVWAGASHAAVRCSVQLIPISLRSRYDALSYVHAASLLTSFARSAHAWD